MPWSRVSDRWQSTWHADDGEACFARRVGIGKTAGVIVDKRRGKFAAAINSIDHLERAGPCG